MKSQRMAELAEAASRGPWYAAKFDDHVAVGSPDIWTVCRIRNEVKKTPLEQIDFTNGDFIAALNPAEVLRMVELMEQMAGALKDLWIACPTGLECNSFHHAKSDQHRFNEECNPREAYLAAIEKSGAALAKYKEWEQS